MTVVCTFPYNGPTEDQLLAMEEEAEMRAEEEAAEREREEREKQRQKMKTQQALEQKLADEAKMAELARNTEDDNTQTMSDKPIYAR